MKNDTAIIFDLDGTLFKTEDLALKSFQLTFFQLKKEDLFQGITPTDKEFLSCLGKTLPEIWDILLKNTKDEVKERANYLMLEYEKKLLRMGLGELYPKVLETLSILKESGYSLFIASNGLEDYVESVLTAKNINKLFSGIYTAGKYNTPYKYELVHFIILNNNIKKGYMVGDRSSDIEAGLKNKLITIGCRYGYGNAEELINAKLIINNFSELLDIVK